QAQASTLYRPGRPAEALEEHRSLMRAIEARDPDRAETLARAHRRKTLALRREMLREQARLSRAGAELFPLPRLRERVTRKARRKGVCHRLRALWLPPPRPAPASGGGSTHAETGSLHSRRLLRLGRQLEDVQPRVGPVDEVDVPAVVGLHVVALDRDLAA